MLSFGDTPLVTAIRAANPHRVLMLGAPVWHDAMPDQLAATGIADVDMFSSLDLASSDRLRHEMEQGPDAAGLQRLTGVDLVVQFGDAACAHGTGMTVPYAFPPAPWINGTARICSDIRTSLPPFWSPVRHAR